MKKEKKSLFNQFFKGSGCSCGVQIVEESKEKEKNNEDSNKVTKK